eukprot:gene3628-4519_t
MSMNTQNKSQNVESSTTTSTTTNSLPEISIEIFSPQKRMKLNHFNINNTTSASNNNNNIVMINKDEDEIGIIEDDEKFSKRLMIPGQTISREGEYLKGHGTFHHEQNLIASVCGRLEKIDKLLSVRAFKARYQGEVGDIIVGRITEIASKRWKVDVNSRQDYFLMLSAINLPGGIQRRRTSSDELQMRNFFVENDLVYAEVQMLMGDGSVAIHTRNLKYGKLQNGHFMKAPSNLIKRSKQHFYTLECGVDIILGLNGYIWIADSEQQKNQTAHIHKHERENFDQPLVISDELKYVSKEGRERISRIKNSISLLIKGFLVISKSSIIKVYKQSIQMNLSAKDLLHPEYISQILAYLSTFGFDDENDDDQQMIE